MKKLFIIFLAFLFSGFVYTQNIKEFSSYAQAMQEFSVGADEEKIMVIYFYDGENSKIEKKIKKQILKSNSFKELGKDLVLLLVDTSKKEQARAYNSRALRAFNSQNIMPSLKVYIPGHRKELPLQTNFSDQEITTFLSKIKSL
ncbi:hypothetical protein ACFQ1Q_01995 [Winogradskyella litorisediminis]|uniref:Uncharacterized protein n=1 Tax=Winogradskyella litorisediminis TaxID=1156618 RepID=A0ABW3N4X3_9FLAO